MRMTDAEAVMWAVEKDPALRSDFCNLTLLEHEPPPERLRAKVATALDALPRLRQRVVAASLRIVPPALEDDPNFDLEYHVREVAVPAPGGPRELLDLTAALADAPFDRSRPMWEFTVITGLADGTTALLQKVHHTITDGVGGLRLSLALVDFEADPPVASATGNDPVATGHDRADASRRSPIDVMRNAILDRATRDAGSAAHLLERAGHVATHPQELPARVTDVARVAASLRRQLFVTDAARSDVMTARSLRRRYETLTVALPAIKLAAKRLGGTVNDAYVTAVSGGLARYHARLGSAVDELRFAMAVSTREQGDTAANRFTPARVLVPLTPDAVPERFAAIHERLAAARSEAALNTLDQLASVAMLFPTSLLVTFTRGQVRTVDVAVSNLRGSPVPLYLGGARILASYPFGPRTGAALNATVLSYGEDLDLGLNIDPDAIKDVPAFMADLEAAFDDVVTAGA